MEGEAESKVSVLFRPGLAPRIKELRGGGVVRQPSNEFVSAFSKATVGRKTDGPEPDVQLLLLDDLRRSLLLQGSVVVGRETAHHTRPVNNVSLDGATQSSIALFLYRNSKQRSQVH